MNIKKATRFVLISVIVTAWIFSGWPAFWPLGELGVNKIRIPPEIEETKAQAPLPTFVACGAGAGGAGAITPALPTGIATNNILLLFLETANELISIPTPNGGTWTGVLNSPQGTGTAAATGATRLTVFWSRYNGTQGNPTTSDSGDHQVGVICAYNGVITTGDPWDVTSGAVDTTSDTSGTIPGATTTGDNRLVVIAGAGDDDADTPVTTVANTDLANISAARVNAETALGNDGGVTVFDGQKASAGAYGNTTLTYTGATIKGMMTIALKPELPTYMQSAYRLFNNLDSTDVGTALAGQDTAATLGSAGAAFRLRMLLHIGANQLIASGQSFKLQFAQRGVDNLCDTAFSGETYADVTAATVIAYKDNTIPADNTALTATSTDPTHGADTIVNQTYEELNNFTNSQAAIPVGQDGKWDFALKDSSAPANTTYCLRAVKSDGTILNTYSVVPQITTAIVISVSVSDGTVAYGMLLQNATSSTITLSDTQIVTNNGNVAETFNVMGSTSTNWTLGATAGTDIYVHKFCTSTCASPPTNYTALTLSYQTANTNVSVNATTTLDLMINTPNLSTVFTQQNVDVTIQAVAY